MAGIEPPTGELQLPDLRDFQAPVAAGHGEPLPGRVAGLDYEQWAAAIIDLNQSPERVSAQRGRIASKGYRLAGGSPLVGGFPHAEVWVIPRPQYEANRQRRQDKIAAAVAGGYMSESATHPEAISKSRAGARAQ